MFSRGWLPTETSQNYSKITICPDRLVRSHLRGKYKEDRWTQDGTHTKNRKQNKLFKTIKVWKTYSCYHELDFRQEEGEKHLKPSTRSGNKTSLAGEMGEKTLQTDQNTDGRTYLYACRQNIKPVSSLEHFIILKASCEYSKY